MEDNTTAAGGGVGAAAGAAAAGGAGGGGGVGGESVLSADVTANGVRGELPLHRMLSLLTQDDDDIHSDNDSGSASGQNGLVGTTAGKDIGTVSTAAPVVVANTNSSDATVGRSLFDSSDRTGNDTAGHYDFVNVGGRRIAVVEEDESALAGEHSLVLKANYGSDRAEGVSQNGNEQQHMNDSAAMTADTHGYLHQEAVQVALNVQKLKPDYPVDLPKSAVSKRQAKSSQHHPPQGAVDEVELAQAIKLYQTADFFGLAICGWILDRVGPRLTEMGAQVICSTGFFLFGSGWLKLPAVLQGLTSTAVLSSVASVSNLFRGREIIATGILVGASDASTLLLPTFVVLTEKFPKITYEGLLTAMGYLSATYVVLACMILPDAPYHRHRHHHHEDNENPGDRPHDREEERQALLNRDESSGSLAMDSVGYHSTNADMLHSSNARESISFRPTNSDGEEVTDGMKPGITEAKLDYSLVTNGGDFRSRFASVQSAPGSVWRRSGTSGRRSYSHSNSVRKVKLTDMSLNEQVSHPLFLCFVGVWTLHALRVCLYMDLNEIFYSYLGDEQVLTRAYSWMMPVGALFSVISGVVCQRSGVRKALFYETIISVLISAVCCIPVLAAQWISMVLFLVLSGSIWTVAVGYIAELFGYTNFGMMMGILSVTVGVVNQTVGGAALHLVLSRGDVCCFYVNAAQLALGAMSVIGNMYIVRHVCDDEKEVFRKVHFGVDDSCPRVSYFYSGKIQSMMPAICFSDTESEDSS
eukprot:Lankesteria_metandrocarpae@DN1511_c0_g1_i1.p1